MEIETDRERFALTRSGSGVEAEDAEITLDGPVEEYPLVYAHLAELVRSVSVHGFETARSTCARWTWLSTPS